MTTPANFDRLARAYRWMEALTFGPFLMRARCAFLGKTKQARRALVLGDGDGRFTARLLAANPNLTIDAVDASPAMLRQLLRNAGPNANRVSTHAADIRTWQPQDRYDLIASHFFLDCLATEEVAALAARLRRAAAPNALWLLSDFDIPTAGAVRLIARPLVGLLYRAFGLLTGLAVRRLPNHSAALVSAGFTLARERKLLGGLLVGQIWTHSPRSETCPSLLQIC
ncbi:MAG TPA: class I SAM-dependent methyltransferase [Terracidiphilus sp.]|jgi:SAM-dependent methyltransferase|nr:class I SAM-dependent methyltransferase [Terracidiphilus sp.]